MEINDPLAVNALMILIDDLIFVPLAAFSRSLKPTQPLNLSPPLFQHPDAFHIGPSTALT